MPNEWPPRLTRQDIKDAAKDLGIEPAALAAVTMVESGGRGFLQDGRPKILFEGHLFWRQLRKRGLDPAAVQRLHPDICYPVWTREHYLGGAREYIRYEKAKAIHADAAVEAASWGLFQLLGLNYKAAGFKTPQEFLLAHKRGEREQLLAICRWMKQNGLADCLAVKNWESFTKGYNGPGQVEFYSARLRQAYARAVERGWNT